MTYFKDFLKDRDNPYEIHLELHIRKLLEANTDIDILIDKNEDVYGYDLIVVCYYLHGATYIRKNICFIEIEISETWKNEYPVHWKTYSFLARKVFDYCYNEGYDNKVLKDNADKTLYLIFNKEINDAVAQTILNISKYKMVHHRITGDERNDYYLRVDKDNDGVIRGIDNVIEHTKKFINLHVEKNNPYIKEATDCAKETKIEQPTFREEREAYAMRNGGDQMSLFF